MIVILLILFRHYQLLIVQIRIIKNICIFGRSLTKSHWWIHSKIIPKFSSTTYTAGEWESHQWVYSRPWGDHWQGCGVMAELCVNSFASVCNESSFNLYLHQQCNGILAHVNITLPTVIKKLSELNVNTSMCPDGLHPKLLKSCPVLAYSLYKIFLTSVQSGILPSKWKMSEIVPMF